MTVINFPGHHWDRCTTCEGCFVCNGGLALCTRCGGAEGSLPTDCPGERMSPFTCDEVYAGRIDYRRREGWVLRVPWMPMPA